ncbi:MAG: hypothetical protein WC710_14710 [Gallionella sp.]|jgi:hypothetical protein
MKNAKKAFLDSLLKKGEKYAGILLGKNGAPDQHIILLPGDADPLNWEAAKKFASKAGGELPTRREQSLLFANLKEEFQERWYWSGEQHAANSSCAWCQNFNYGYQLSYYESSECRARAVRRKTI